MNKTELINQIALDAGLTKTGAASALGAFEAHVTRVLRQGGSVTLPGFGTFAVAKRAARVGRNPKTGETLEIKARRAPTFKAGKALKDAVN